MLNYAGSIEDVLRSGDYDSADTVTVDYDELFDLVEQARFLAEYTRSEVGAGDNAEIVFRAMQSRTNRPLHPCLGGKSPYSEFLPL